MQRYKAQTQHDLFEGNEERKLRANGTWEPIVGDIVFQIRPGFGGMPATLWGKVIKKGGKLRVEPMSVDALMGMGSIQHGKTYPLDNHWTVKDDPEFIARKNAREAERLELERQKEKEDEERKARSARNRDDLFKEKQPLRTWADAKRGDILATTSSYSGEKILYRFVGTEKSQVIAGVIYGIGVEIFPEKSKAKIALSSPGDYVKEDRAYTMQQVFEGAGALRSLARRPRHQGVPAESVPAERKGKAIKLVKMKRYRLLTTSGWHNKVGRVVTYTGFYPGHFECDVCFGKEKGGHEFLVGDPENSTYAYHIGKTCITKAQDEFNIAPLDELSNKGIIYGEIASIKPPKVTGDDGKEYALSREGAEAISDRESGERVEMEYCDGEWYAFTVEPTDEARETMRQVFALVEARSGFPSAGRGMEWGDAEQVTPDNFAGYYRRVLGGDGIFTISTMTRISIINGKVLASTESQGRPAIKVSQDGKGFDTLEGKRYVYAFAYLVHFMPKEKARPQVAAPVHVDEPMSPEEVAAAQAVAREREIELLRRSAQGAARAQARAAEMERRLADPSTPEGQVQAQMKAEREEREAAIKKHMPIWDKEVGLDVLAVPDRKSLVMGVPATDKNPKSAKWFEVWSRKPPRVLITRVKREEVHRYLARLFIDNDEKRMIAAARRIDNADE